jgi:hypothetical protein
MGGLISKVKSTAEKSTKTEKMSPVGMTYFEKAQTSFKPPLIANENAFLGDIASRYVTVGLLLISLRDYGFPAK